MLRLEACLTGEAANTIKGLGYSPSKLRMASRLKIAMSRCEMENIIIILEEDLEATSVIRVEKEIRCVVYVPEVIL